MKKFLFFLGVVPLVLSGCGGPVTVGQIEKTGGRQLNSQEILQLVDGNTLHCESFQEDLNFYFDESRRVYGGDIDKNKDQGHWDVSNKDEICFKFKKWWFNDLRCFSVYDDNKKIRLFTPNGALVYTGQSLPGDAKHLYVASRVKRRSYRAAGKKREKSAGITKTEPEESISVIEESRPQTKSLSHETELKSTVKWMARDCPGCNLVGADLRKADLVAAQLQGARLKGANLRQANLRRADLRNADLSQSILAYANMPGADLRDCDLSNADLTGANLIRADLTGANLDGTVLRGAHLEGVKGLAPSTL